MQSMWRNLHGETDVVQTVYVCVVSSMWSMVWWCNVCGAMYVMIFMRCNLHGVIYAVSPGEASYMAQPMLRNLWRHLRSSRGNEPSTTLTSKAA